MTKLDPQAGGFPRGSGFGFRVPCSGFRIPGFGFRVPGFGFRASVFGVRVSGFGFRVSGSGAHGSSSLKSNTPRQVDVRPPGKGNSNSHGARPVYLNDLDDQVDSDQ